MVLGAVVLNLLIRNNFQSAGPLKLKPKNKSGHLLILPNHFVDWKSFLKIGPFEPKITRVHINITFNLPVKSEGPAWSCS